MKKHILPNGIAVNQAASLPSPPRGGSQTGSHRSGCRPRESKRKWGLYLVRRSKTFYFRRRWPKKFCEHGAPAFLSVSLRTQIHSEAVKRSVGLLSAVEVGEKRVIVELQNKTIAEGRVAAMLKEIVRRAFVSM